MSSASAGSVSPAKSVGIRGRARFPKARPNVLGAERRSGTPAPSTPKPTACAEDNEIKTPPPVRRMARLDFLPPKPVAESVPQPSVALTLTAAGNVDTIETEPPEPSLPSEQPPPSVTSVLNVVPDPEKTLLSPTPLVIKQRERKLSSRGGNENREREQAKGERCKKVVKPPERSKMTMFDLIYWNPTSNPMTYEEDECRIPLSNKEANVPDQLPNSERLAAESVDDPENVEESVNGPEEIENDTEQDDDQDCMPVPQVKIGPDGRIVLDEQSLVIETSASKKDLSSSPAVYERSSNTTYSSFRKKKHARCWSDKETAKFYMALSSVGTDFSMMLNLFPKRTRNELKLKFKREERANKALVDRAVRDHQQYDLSLFQESDEEVENHESNSGVGALRIPRKGAARGGKKAVGNTEAPDIGTKKTATRKKRVSKQYWQEQSDSDFDGSSVVSDKATDTVDQPVGTPSTTPRVDDRTVDGKDPTISNDVKEYEVDVEEDLNLDDDTGEEYNDSEKILEGVLKQTRSGRQPKKKSPFTIDFEEPKRHRKKLKVTHLGKKKRVSQNAKSPVSARSVPLSPGVDYVSPGQLVFVAEEAAEDGSQVVHLYMLSPPVHSSAAKKSITSPMSDHDYAKQKWSCEQIVNIPTYMPETGEVVGVVATVACSPSAGAVQPIRVDDAAIQSQPSGTGDLLQL